jgi:hypothetical protein
MMDAVIVGTSYAGVILPPNAATQIIAPSTNANGVYIKTLAAQLATGNTPAFLNALFVCNGTTVPTIGPSNLPTNIILCLYSSPNSGTSFNLPYPLYLPAGQGLWGYFNSGGTGNGEIYSTYDVL